MAEKKSNGSGRTRNYATVIYPESAPENWVEILSEQHIPMFISPLHCNDVNPNGEPKKPHYHTVVMFDSVKTVEQAKELFALVNGVGCEKISSIRGYARYLCHLDNPEKAIYDVSQVKCLGGADYISVIGLPTDKYIAIQEMMDFVDENGNYSFADLMRYARSNRSDWFRALCDNSCYVMKEYCKSAQWTSENNI